MMFTSKDKNLAWNEHVKSEFQKAVVRLVIGVTSVSASRMHNIDSYFSQGEATVIFLLVGAGKLKNGEHQAYQRSGPMFMIIRI